VLTGMRLLGNFDGLCEIGHGLCLEPVRERDGAPKVQLA